MNIISGWFWLVPELAPSHQGGVVRKLKKNTPVFASAAWVFAALACVLLLMPWSSSSTANAVLGSLSGLFAGLTVLAALLHYTRPR
jgi:hypothetical protein